jgi:2'-5' RNA ligase
VTSFKAFVVVEIPEPVRSQIQAIRDQLKTPTAKLPVEITLAGSSEVGPIPEGTEIAVIKEAVDKIATDTDTFSMSFGKIANFPNTNIVYTPPIDRTPFDTLHKALSTSTIPFSDSKFPYTPHCTLANGLSAKAQALNEIHQLAIPQRPFLIDTISVYELDEETHRVSLIHRANFNKE